MTAPVARRRRAMPSETRRGGAFAEQSTDLTRADLLAAAPLHSEDSPEVVTKASESPARPRPFVVPDLAGFHELRIWAESFEDAQDHRNRLMNRLGLRADGTEQTTGARVPPALFEQLVAPLRAQEHVIALAMRGCYRRVAPPGVVEWQKQMFGIGEHLLARFLGSLGHPRIAAPFHWEGEGEDRKLIPDLMFERTLRQLWAYCGHGDPGRKKRKGMSAEEAFTLGNPRCKMLVHLLAVASMKCRVEPSASAAAIEPAADPADLTEPETPSPSPDQSTAATTAKDRSAGRDSSVGQPNGNPSATSCAADRRYRSIYDEARVKYADRDGWTPGHQHAAALRLVGKEILRDLWVASE